MQFIFVNCTSEKLFHWKEKKKILSKLKWRISLQKWLQQILSFIFMVSVIKRMASSCTYMQMGRTEKFRTHVYFRFLEFHKRKKKKIQFSDLFALCRPFGMFGMNHFRVEKKRDWTMNEWKICENNKRWFPCSLTLLVQNGKHPF